MFILLYYHSLTFFQTATRIRNMLKFSIIVLFLLLSINGLGLMATECEIPKYCEIKDMNIFFADSHKNHLICSIKESSQLRFDIDKRNEKIDQNKCNKTKMYPLIIKPGLFESNVKLSGKSVDAKSLVKYISTINSLEFQSFKGFDLQLFQYSDINKSTSFDYLSSLSFKECLLKFYIGDKLMKSCQDYYDSAENLSTSIFHCNVFQQFKENPISFSLFLAELKDKICPLAFKNVLIEFLQLNGENSYFSQRTIKFSNETFNDLNSNIIYLTINIGNVEIDLDLVHPSVFQQTKSIYIYNGVKSIHPGLFLKLKSIKTIHFESLYLRSFIHRQGIDWIMSINRDARVSLSDQQQVNEWFKNNSPVSILFTCSSISSDLPISEVFPDEDFCIYRDFPFDQMVIIVPILADDSDIKIKMNPNLSCTFLWLSQYYSKYNVTVESFDISYFYIMNLMDSEEFKSMSKCNFEHRISLCNKSDFHIKPIISYYEIGQSMIWTKSILNITSYLLCIFGFVTNLFVLITISSKKNKAEFKEFNQYKYMRINSICSLLLLSIHFLSWLTECNYPYGIFCSEVRKTLFFQFLKIILGQVLSTSLRFMINFAYIAFSFCRLALIGKDPNKLVKFMSEIGIKKYVSISLFISLILSAIKFFSYRINYGMIEYSYPMNYDFESSTDFISVSAYKSYFIINFISDFLNYVVFLLIHLSLDIGMVIKLRKTLNDRLEKSIEYNSKEQQEKKQTENESVLNNAISMVILNTVVGVLLKFPTCVYSLVFMNFIIKNKEASNLSNNPRLAFFMQHFCEDFYFCDMFFTLTDFLYLLYISIQVFFYIRFDKKFKIALKRLFTVKESNNAK